MSHFHPLKLKLSFVYDSFLQFKESAALKTRLVEPSLNVTAEVSFWEEATENVDTP